MKNIAFFFLLTCSFLALSSCEKESILPDQKIPAEIKNFVSTHFPNCSIIRAVEENFEREKYEITLSCGVKLEFDKNKKILDIDSNQKLPDSVIPDKILTYVQTNYPANYIIGWELQNNTQKVDLDADFTLVFNLQSDFLYSED